MLHFEPHCFVSISIKLIIFARSEISFLQYPAQNRPVSNRLSLENEKCICDFHLQYSNVSGARGGVVVKALRYKPAGRGFDSIGIFPCGVTGFFSVTYFFRPYHGPGGRFNP